MYRYILDIKTKDWIESEELYPSDTALLIDNEKRMVYLYSGPGASKSNQQLGEQLASKLLEKYKMYTFQTLSDVIPMQLQVEIDLLVGEHKTDTRESEPRTVILFVYMIVAGVMGVAGLLLLISQLFMLGWNYQDNVYLVTDEDFTKFFSFGENIALIVMLIGLLMFLLSMVTKKMFLVGSSLISCGISIALWYYIGRKEFLFSFAPTSPYSVSRLELFFYLLVVSISILVLTGIIIFCIYSILKETVIQRNEKMDMDEMRLKSRPSILRDKEPVTMEEIED